MNEKLKVAAELALPLDAVIRVVHAEVNALLFSREPVAGYTLYTYPIACCPRCAVQMIQSGISRFVFPVVPVDKRDRWTEYG